MQTLKNGRTILVGEDEMEVRGYLEMALKCLGYSVELAQDGDEVLSCLESSRSEIAAVLLDIMMPNRDGIDTLREIHRIDPTLPVIIVSGAASTLNVVTAMKTGATDFLCKPVAHDDLRKAVTRALEMRGVNYVPPARSAAPVTRTFLGTNPRMQEIHALVGQIGWSEAPVLIQGETGTGKEIIARELHAQSPRARKPFLKLNCAALPSELVESELFGYERGAFTGAFQKKAGMFELADGGTILLDEIGDMDVRLQAKLLQVLQDQEFQRIGGKETIKVDVRVMAATHRDLEKAIADRTFREDLYYRLNVINLVLPPLHERSEDIVPMAEFLMKKHSVQGVAMPAITMDLKHAMMTYHWPGNVRELENFVRKFLILRDTEMLTRELHAKATRKPLRAAAAIVDSHAAAATAVPVATSAPILEQVTKAKQQAETDAILAALNSTRWNRKQAAALLKIDYKALLYKMKKLGVEDRTVPFPAASQPIARAAGASID
ncbi:MAG TPA: sigma-54 dependent transcriptional regulator [Candidatus Acidoferrales bacterium]|nr:sigma-54 dependent transcriptional regulator [Candidatus Acidoferrales bacterium]